MAMRTLLECCIVNIDNLLTFATLPLTVHTITPFKIRHRAVNALKLHNYATQTLFPSNIKSACGHNGCCFSCSYLRFAAEN